MLRTIVRAAPLLALALTACHRDDGRTGSPAPTAAPAATPRVPVTPGQIAEVMTVWRTAIVARNPDDVLTCDRLFNEEPQSFRQALVKSAYEDPDPRVRAFSARVLGRFRDPTLTPVFRRLLADESPYVRRNGATGLGELGAAAGEASAELTRLAATDSSEDVRRAARKALSGGDGEGRSMRSAARQ